MSLIIDLLAVLVLVAAVRAGWRCGGTAAVLRMTGLVLGLLLGLTVARTVVSARTSPVLHLLLGLLIVLGCVLVGSSLGGWVAGRLLPRRAGAGVRAVARLDRFAGAALYGVSAALLCVLVLGAVTAFGPSTWATAVRRSAAAHVLSPADSMLHDAGNGVLADAPGDIAALVPAGGHLPDSARASSVASSVAASVVEVDADGCSGGVQGTGFVVGDGHTVITNAHIVRGARSATITSVDGTTATARVVGFDPTPDLAVLYTDAVTGPALPVGPDATNGTPAVIVGYPDGTRTTTPASIISRMPITGPSWAGFSLHEAYVLDAAVRHGNSGSPLLDLAGHVRGVVNALSTHDPNAGFATTASELEHTLAHSSTTSTAPNVSTGTCATSEGTP